MNLNDSLDHSYSILSACICPNELSSPVTEPLDKIICQFLEEQNVPGATLAVARNGHILYEQGYGVAGAGRRMKAKTRLRVASISKPVTAIAVLRLCQEGQLSLDDLVFGAKGVLKKFKTRGDKRLSQVTVRHLLQHSAGWDRDVAGDAVFWSVQPPPGVKVTSPQYNAHLLQYVLNRKLQFTPGTKYAYSNLGYLVLGEVIEAVTGQSYKSYVTSLLSDMGVTDMYVGGEERVDWQSTEGEYFNIKEPTTAASVMPGQEGSSVLPQYGSYLMHNTGAFGGWVATAADVLTILCSLESGHSKSVNSTIVEDQEWSRDSVTTHSQHSGHKTTLLDPSSIQSMLEYPSYESGRDWYGLGLDVQDWGQTWGHTGAMEGTCGTVHRHHSGVSWAFLLNAWATDMDLDGVVKLALSSVDRISPFPQGVAQMHGEMLCVTTEDEHQCIVTSIPCQKVWQEIGEKEVKGYEPVWVGVNTVEEKRGSSVTFNLVFSRCADSRERKISLDVDLGQLKMVLGQYQERGFQPEFITTYVGDDKVLSMAVLLLSDGTCRQEVDIGVPADEYVKLLRRRRKCGYRVRSQSVSQWKSELLVTAIMERDQSGNSVSSCGQIKTGQTEDFEDGAHSQIGQKRKSLSSFTDDELLSPGSSLQTLISDNPSDLTELPEEENILPFGKNESLNHCPEQHENAQDTSQEVQSISRSPRNRMKRPRRKLFQKVRHRTLSWVQMTVDSFVAELGRQARHRTGLQNVQFYPADGDWFVSGVWSPRWTRNCYHRINVSRLGLLPALAEAAAKNVYLRFLYQYEEDGGLYYALFWDATQVL